MAAFKKTYLIFLIVLCSKLLHAQQSIPPQVRVTLHFKNITITDLFARITKQTGYTINYGNKYIHEKEKITVNFTNKPLSQVIDQLLSERGLDYGVFVADKAIVIKKPEPGAAQKTADKPALDTRTAEGMVTDSLSQGLSGTSVSIKGASRAIATDENGRFSFPGVPVPATLEFNRIGFQPVEMEWNGRETLQVTLRESVQQIEDVTVASTGYQQIKRSRSAASYTVIDNNLLNRSISTNILDRLKGVASGVLFDNNAGNSIGITIRGRSTIFGDATPLIVLDNYPYEGELSDINPNDIESITILKDAVAAAIWGTRAGNGVIVIQSKKGISGKPKVGFSANFTASGKPDLYHRPQLTSEDYIEVQQYLVGQGRYAGLPSYMAVDPAARIMLNRLNGSISAQDSLNQINALKQQDVRDDLTRYFYQNSFNQQYQVNVRGGAANQTYYFSAGYDHNRPVNAGAYYERFSLKGNHGLSLLNKKLQINTDLFFTTSGARELTNSYTPSYPYARLADDNGKPLDVVIPNGLSRAYTDMATAQGLLDWKFRPLEEVQNRYDANKTIINDYRLNLTVAYKLFKGFTVSGNYQYNKATNNKDRLIDSAAFILRNQINTFTPNPITGPSAFPKGSLLNTDRTDLTSHFIRVQAAYDRDFGTRHSVNAILGYERRKQDKDISRETKYGYNPSTGISSPVDLNSLYPYYYNPALSGVLLNFSPNSIWEAGRNRSVYSTASYLFDKKYMVSGSVRRDESNLFGVNANQKGVPLWSAGLGWILSKEVFYNIEWLPYLKLSGSYGYNGNVDNSISAYLTIQPSVTNNSYGNAFATIKDPPNPSLRWERVRNINVLVDFSSRNNRISGTLEFYSKNGLDLIGNSPIPQQTGITTFRGNTANVNGQGVDLQLNSINLKGKLRWETNVLFNYNRERVKSYKAAPGSNREIVLGAFNSNPLVGYPVRSVFALPFLGLDTLGRPVGIIDNKPSIDYTNINGSLNRSDLHFYGALLPTIFGSVRNSFSYKNLSFSFNLIYKWDYYFRRQGINYATIFRGEETGYMMPDFKNRWKKKGDELFTDIPGMPSLSGPESRQEFYSSSSALVEKGDHVRLQDIQFSWSLARAVLPRLPFKAMSVNFYANNLGIIWRANKRNLDPDALNVPLIRTYSIGLKAEF